MSAMSNRLTEAVKCCQIIDGQLHDGAAPDGLDRELIEAMGSYTKAWEQGKSRKQAWAEELEAV